MGEAAPVAPEDLPLRDLHRIVELGLARGALLLTAGEMVVARRIRDLAGPAGRLYARLTARVPEVFAVDGLSGPGIPDPHAAVDDLVGIGLLDDNIPWDRRLDAVTVPELREGCAAVGLPRGGRRGELVDRLRGRTGWTDRRFVRVRHRGLVDRLARWALLRRRPDRSAFVVARLGHVRWPTYRPTAGAALFPDRRSLLRWEGRYAAMDAVDPQTWLAWLEDPVPAPGRLDLTRSLVRRVLEAARDLERHGDVARAAALYVALIDGGHVAGPDVAVRHARCVELAGDREAALALLSRARRHADGAARVAIDRAGKRLARALRRGWAPSPPLRSPRERHWRLPRVGRAGPRPTWGRGEVVERAVADRLAAAGRTVVRGEGPLWTTLFALLFAEVSFLPLEGVLPAPFLTGPLDGGTPAFAARRPLAVAEVLDGVRRGEAPERLADAIARWDGVALAGVAWDRAPHVPQVAAGLGPGALEAVLVELLAKGWAAARGLPDLVVLSGPPVEVDAFPRRVGPGLILAEVKGPSDALRDGQRVWLDRLIRSGASAEVWHVAEAAAGRTERDP